jgi:ribokinase
VIVIVGSPIAQPSSHGIAAGGLSAAIALAAARAGAAVQIVGRVGEDAAGDQVLLALAAAGVGHVAVLREPGRPTPAAPPRVGESPSPDGPALGESLLDDSHGALADGDPSPAGLSVDAADLELALRYVPDYRVLVIAADLDPPALEAVVAAAGWSGAHLVAVIGEGSPTERLPERTTVLERPASDPDGVFGKIVAAYAVALDQGDEPAAAFAAAQRSGGWAAVAE